MKEREEEESEWVSVLLLADFYPRKPCGNDHKYLFYAHSSLYRSVHIDRLHCSAWLNERIHIQRNPYSAAKVTFLLALKFSFSLLLCKWYGKKKNKAAGGKCISVWTAHKNRMKPQKPCPVCLIRQWKALSRLSSLRRAFCLFWFYVCMWVWTLWEAAYRRTMSSSLGWKAKWCLQPMLLDTVLKGWLYLRWQVHSSKTYSFPGAFVSLSDLRVDINLVCCLTVHHIGF